MRAAYLLLWLAILGSSTHALEPPQSMATDWNQPQAERALVLGLQTDLGRGEEAFGICRGCHRPGALGRPDGSYPRLAGQHYEVLIKQMTDVRSGLRANPKMLPFADEHALTAQDIADIAAYLQRLPTPANQGTGPGTDLNQADALYRKGCLVCHGVAGQGEARQYYPRIAGQHFRYLLRSMRMIRDGERRNAHPAMVEAIRGYTEDDLTAVADLVSRMTTSASR